MSMQSWLNRIFGHNHVSSVHGHEGDCPIPGVPSVYREPKNEPSYWRRDGNAIIEEAIRREQRRARG